MADWALTEDRWLAERLDRPCYRLAPGEEPIAAILPRLRDRPHAFAWTRVEADRTDATGALEDAGFRVVDCGLRFERSGFEANESAPTGLRPARPEDEEAVAAIAADAFRGSRFHLDPRIDPATADALKADWARGFFHGTRGEGLMVAEDASGVAGFLLWLRAPDGAFVIDLVAVAARARGRGLAGALSRAAWLDAGGPSRLRVGTQVANTRASRAYARFGFALVAAEYVLHYHGA